MPASFPPRWFAGAVLALVVAACASDPPLGPRQAPVRNPAADTAALREATLRTWRSRILPRFVSHLETRSPGLAAQLTLEVVDRPRSAEPCRGASADLELTTAAVTDLHRLAEAIVFIAREPRYAQRLAPYIRHVRDARFGSTDAATIADGVLPFDAYAQIPSDRFAQILQDPPMAKLRTLLERETLAVMLAQKIGEVATETAIAGGESPPPCSREAEAAADAYAADLILASRPAPLPGMFPAYLLFTIVDADPRANPRQHASLRCRAQYFARRDADGAPAGGQRNTTGRSASDGDDYQLAIERFIGQPLPGCDPRPTP